MDRDFVKTQKEKGGQYHAILADVAWSIKDLLYVYGIKKTEKNNLRTCLFASTEKEASYSKSDGAFRFSRFLVLIYFRAPAWT